MSLKGEVLYVKGMNVSEPDSDDNDPWDDIMLTTAYDRAVGIAKAEVAKRIAMATNSVAGKQDSKNEKPPLHSSSKKPAASKPGGSKKKSSKQKTWAVGGPCRAVYCDDGLEYEAYIMELLDDTECVVRFVGYDNEEVVPMDILRPSWGEKYRAEQIQDALGNAADSSQSEMSYVQTKREKMDCENMSTTPLSTEKLTSVPRRKTSLKKKRTAANFRMPDMMPNLPFSMNGFAPQMPFLGDLSDMELPMPPPTPFMPGESTDNSEEQAVSAMLLSWYMSGYYTGLYRGMMRAKKTRNSRQTNS